MVQRYIEYEPREKIIPLKQIADDFKKVVSVFEKSEQEFEKNLQREKLL